MLSEEFEKRILKCVDKALDAFGESFRPVVYYYAERNFGLKRHDIVERAQEFLDALRNLFGAGAYVIERTLVEEMRSEFNIKLAEWSFAKAVEETRRYPQRCNH